MVELIINIKDFKEFIEEGFCCLLLKANWCKTSLMLAVSFDRLAKKYRHRIKFGKIDIDSFKEYVAYEKVGAIPECIIYEDGKLISRSYCTQEEDLETFLMKSFSSNKC